MAVRVKRTEMHHGAKFWRNWSILCVEFVPFQIFKMRAVCHRAYLKFECFTL